MTFLAAFDLVCYQSIQYSFLKSTRRFFTVLDLEFYISNGPAPITVLLRRVQDPKGRRIRVGVRGELPGGDNRMGRLRGNCLVAAGGCVRNIHPL